MNPFIEYLKSFLGEDADLTAIETELQKHVEDQMTGLNKKKEELLGEKKALKQEYDDLVSKYSFFKENEVTQETYEQLLSDIETYKNTADEGTKEISEIKQERYEAGKSSKEKELLPKIERLQKDKDFLEQSLEDKKEQFNKFIIENKLREALNSMNIHYDQIWFKGLTSSVDYEIDESNGNIQISVPTQTEAGDIPLSDWAKFFPTTDIGKKMIKAPVNTGGGATGGTGAKKENKPESSEDMYARLFKLKT